MSVIIPQRTCKKCSTSYPVTSDHWHKDKTSKDGFSYSCKECAKARARQWGADNQEYANQQARDYYATHKDERKQYIIDNAEQVAATKRNWRKNNPDKVAAEKKRHYQKYKARIREYGRAWYQRNKKRIRAKGLSPEQRRQASLRACRWAKLNPDKVADYKHRRRALLMGNGGDGFTKEDKALQLRAQNGNCWWCLKPMGKDITIDHIVPISKGGQHDPRNIVLAHKSCNCSKKAKLPHEWIGRLF